MKKDILNTNSGFTTDFRHWAKMYDFIYRTDYKSWLRVQFESEQQANEFFRTCANGYKLNSEIYSYTHEESTAYIVDIKLKEGIFHPYC